MLWVLAFVAVLLVASVIAVRTKIVLYDDLAHLGTWLQGIAAVAAVAIAVYKGDEILAAINNLSAVVQRVEKVVNEANERLKVLTIPPSDTENPEAEKESWREELEILPDSPGGSEPAYIPNKDELIEKLVSVKGPQAAHEKAKILQSAIQVDQSALGADKEFQAKIETKNGRPQILLEYKQK